MFLAKDRDQMKSKTFLITIFALVISACSPAVTAMPTKTDIPIPSATLTSVATLPPTFTPVPASTRVQVTPTALYTPIELAPADNEVYQKALSDISLYRQGDIQINVQDESGNPLAGYQVKFRQTSHDFLFGGVGDAFHMNKLEQAGINTMTVYLAWNWIQPEYGKYDLDFTNYWLGIDELKTGGISLKTNAFFVLADDMAPFYKDVPYDQFLERLYEHESTTVKRFAPAVDFWEAILEPNFGNHNPLNLTRDEYYQAVATSIKAIRDHDPTAIVEINLSYPCGGIDWLDNFQIVQEMLDRNLDFDVIGLQYYYNAFILAGNYPMPRMSFSEMSACYDKYAGMLTPYGKRIVGSEFSVPSEAPAGQIGYWGVPWSEDTQAQYLTTAYTIFFSKPSNMGLIWWDTVQPSAFMYEGGILREGGIPKKSYHALQRLLESWRTTGESVTDDHGTVTFRGFGGEYELEIMDPAHEESMVTQVHIAEQKSANETIKFVPSNWLYEKRTGLEKLVAYWESKSEQDFVRKGQDYLALVDHHMGNAEWFLARQTLAAALEELANTVEFTIPNTEFVPVGYQGAGYTIEDGSNLIWGSTTLHFPYDFPPGTVTVEIRAHSNNEKGESPIMVSGVGANYSPVWRVENQRSEVYSYTVSTTGNEQDFTIRFPYDGRIYDRITAQNGEVGGLKLYIDQVKVVIKTIEVP